MNGAWFETGISAGAPPLTPDLSLHRPLRVKGGSAVIRDLLPPSGLEPLVTETGLTIRQMPSGPQLRSRRDITVAQLYMAWATLDVSLAPVAQRRTDEAARLLRILTALTAKRTELARHT